MTILRPFLLAASCFASAFFAAPGRTAELPDEAVPADPPVAVSEPPPAPAGTTNETGSVRPEPPPRLLPPGVRIPPPGSGRPGVRPSLPRPGVRPPAPGSRVRPPRAVAPPPSAAGDSRSRIERELEQEREEARKRVEKRNEEREKRRQELEKRRREQAEEMAKLSPGERERRMHEAAVDIILKGGEPPLPVELNAEDLARLKAAGFTVSDEPKSNATKRSGPTNP